MREDDCIQIFNAAVNAVKPNRLIPQHLYWEGEALIACGKRFDNEDLRNIYVLSVGKAGAAMAQEAEKVLGVKITRGLVVTKYDHRMPLTYCTTIEAGHPVPDGNGIAAAKAIRDFLQPLTKDDLLLCFISGGASALIGDIAEGISLEDVQTLSKLLLQSGADIHQINTVRKHISTLKGGQLVRYANGANIVSFIISDVLGDDMGVIASGLTVGDSSTFLDACEVLKKYRLTDAMPATITQRLQKGIANTMAETPKPNDPLFNRVHNTIIGSNSVALQAAVTKAQRLGYETHIVNNHLQGEAKDEAKKFIDIILNYTGNKPACLLMGGETTVTIRGTGKGGRNQEFMLAALCELLSRNISAENWPVILSGGTDGTDGPTDAAGAHINRSIFFNMNKLPQKPEYFLNNNDAYHFFKAVGGLLITKPTQTNVMDIIVNLIDA